MFTIQSLFTQIWKKKHDLETFANVSNFEIRKFEEKKFEFFTHKQQAYVNEGATYVCLTISLWV